jgi:hypothetical protein
MLASKQFRSAVGDVGALCPPDPRDTAARPGLRSGGLVLRVDAVLTEPGVEPLDLVGELLASLGQIRQRRPRGGPLLLPRGLGGQQLLLPVTQRRGLLILLGIGGGVALAADPVDLLVQAGGVRPGAHSLLNGCQPSLDRVQASLYRVVAEHDVPPAPVGWPAKDRRLGHRHAFQGQPAIRLLPADELDDLLPDPVQVGAQLDQHLGGHAVALTDEAEQDVLGADVVVAELQRLPQRQLEHLLGPRRERDVPGRRLLAPADDLFNLLAHGIRLIPSDSSVLAATPSPSWMRPSRMCSVPM